MLFVKTTLKMSRDVLNEEPRKNLNFDNIFLTYFEKYQKYFPILDILKF